MVDRLERRGLARRRVLTTDRRVKHVLLTPLGVSTKQDLLASMNEPPAALRALSHEDLQTLLTSLSKLPFSTAPGPPATSEQPTTNDSAARALPRGRQRRAQ